MPFLILSILKLGFLTQNCILYKVRYQMSKFNVDFFLHLVYLQAASSWEFDVGEDPGSLKKRRRHPMLGLGRAWT